MNGSARFGDIRIRIMHSVPLTPLIGELYQIDEAEPAPWVEPFQYKDEGPGQNRFRIHWPEGLQVRTGVRGRWSTIRTALQSCRERGYLPRPFGYVQRFYTHIVVDDDEMLDTYVSFPELGAGVRFPALAQLTDKRAMILGVEILLTAEEKGGLSGPTNNPA